MGNNPRNPEKEYVYSEAQNQTTMNSDKETTKENSQNNTNVSTQATDNTVNNNQAMIQDNQQPSQTLDNAKMTHKTSEENMNQMTQSNAKELPATGETSNSTLITLVASVLLAAGSLLTFNRFSKYNK